MNCTLQGKRIADKAGPTPRAKMVNPRIIGDQEVVHTPGLEGDWGLTPDAEDHVPDSNDLILKIEGPIPIQETGDPD